MLSINTNLSSLIAQQSMKTSTDKLNQAIERMTTGAKINHAKDNAANYSISTNMTTKMSAYDVAADNVAMGMDLVSTFNENIELISNKLSRLRQLALQLENGTYGEQSKTAIEDESKAILSEIEQIYNTTEYNGIDLMKGKTVTCVESKFIKEIERQDTSEMTRLKSIDSNERIDSGIYSIYTAEELAQLAEMTNNGLIGRNVEFVLGADIDLGGYENWTPIGVLTVDGSIYFPFEATFDGNGYIVSNLKINTTAYNVGLFGYTQVAKIKNLGVEDANVYSRANSIGILIGHSAGGTTIDNCYVEGELTAKTNIAGICGNFRGKSITNCYSSANITSYFGGSNIGGVAGTFSADLAENCFSTGNISGADSVGGLFGYCSASSGPINFSYSTATVTGTIANIGDIVGNNKASNNIHIAPIGSISNNALVKTMTNKLELQIGINANNTSRLELDALLELSQFSYLKNMNSENSSRCISIIDELKFQLNEKMTTNGSLLNLMEAILEEITVKYDNLASSRSTIRDADIAEVSAEYIQQQILQQASATLMATTNQSPAIALQLI